MKRKRTILLEQVTQAWLKDHQGLKNFMSGFGPKVECGCVVCEKAREALK